MRTFEVDSPEADFLRAAYLRKQPEITARVVSDTENVFIDPLSVSTAIDGVFPRLFTLRAPLCAKINGFDLDKFDSLPDYGHALHYCHSVQLAAIKPALKLPPELLGRAAAMRDRLLFDASLLSGRAIIPADSIANVKKVLGRRGTLLDLTLLQNVFKQHGAAIRGRCAVTEGELEEANQLIARLSAGVSLRERAPQQLAEAKLARRKAFFLLYDVYEEIRVCVRLLRHHQRDYDSYAPSVFANPNAGRKPVARD